MVQNLFLFPRMRQGGKDGRSTEAPASRFSFASLALFIFLRHTRVLPGLREIASQSKFTMLRLIIISRRRRDIVAERFVPRRKLFLTKHEKINDVIS